MTLRTALIQMTSGDDPAANLIAVTKLVERAVQGGARFVLTPEVTNCVSSSRDHQRKVLVFEEADPTLSGLRDVAARNGIWLLIGSIALRTHEDPRFANRSFLLTPEGQIVTRYDKIHMFDVDVSETEVYRESLGYRPGDRAVIAHTPIGHIGMSICYDVRFPYLYRALAQGGAEILTVPSAFNPTTGAAHWETLLRARAIETGCYVLAPAQCGAHPHTVGAARQSYGHTLAISPWGEILADGGTEPGVSFVDINLGEVMRARTRIPSIFNDRTFAGP